SKPKIVRCDPLEDGSTPPGVGIVGFEHKYSKDVVQFNVPEIDSQTPLIGLTHLVMGEKPGMFYKEEQYGIEEFKASPIRLFLNGHIHTPLGPLTNSNRQIFCQPGAFRRTNTASEEIGRVPQVTLITVEWSSDPKPAITCKYLPINVKEGIFRDYEK